MPIASDEPHHRPTAAPVRPRPRRRQRFATVAGAVLVLIVLAAAGTVQGTRYDTQALSRLPADRERGAPAWSRPCWRPNPAPYDGWYTLACVRVAGRVVYRQRHDPDGDADAHLLVVAGAHVVNLKFRNAAGGQGLPGLGRRIVVVGLLSAGRMHVPEVDVRRIG
jgi:hypothetical protein